MQKQNKKNCSTGDELFNHKTHTVRRRRHLCPISALTPRHPHSPMGLYKYNHLPQVLCNSPGSFKRMMTSMFGDQNYLSLLCCLDDLSVFAPDEETALQRLDMVFDRLHIYKIWNWPPKRVSSLRKSVKFLRHIIDNGVQQTWVGWDHHKCDYDWPHGTR